MIIRTAEEIGGAIYEARRRRHLTQVELARQAGVTSRWLREVEHGKPRAEIGLVLRIMGYLNIELDLQIANPKNNENLQTDEYPNLDDIINGCR